MMEARPKSPRSVRALLLLCFVILFAPLATILFLSLFSAPEGLPDASGPSLFWYERMLENPLVTQALTRSLLVALATSSIATVIGTMGALAIERRDFPGKRALIALTTIPLALPELVMGIGFVLWFSWLRMTLGLHSIIIAHVTFTLSYVVITVRARLADVDPALEEAARDLGATTFTVFRRITLPLLFPGIVGAWMMAFTLSFDDFLISYFTSGVNNDTLPIKLYGMIRFGLNKEMYALATSLVVVTTLGLLAHHLLGLRLLPRHPANARRSS